MTKDKRQTGQKHEAVIQDDKTNVNKRSNLIQGSKPKEKNMFWMPYFGSDSIVVATDFQGSGEAGS